MIAIVDYGMGNLRSVQKSFERVGASAVIVSSAEEISRASKVILPGVGAFGDAMTNLQNRGLVRPLVEAIRAGRPFLGICLGLQLLFDVGYEDGEFTGLGLVPGRVVRFNFDGRPAARDLKIPHMGWNQVTWSDPCPLTTGIPSGSYFYFVHSYYVDPIDPAYTYGTCDYGDPFTAIIWRYNLFATQFHPEKSQKLGLQILENFANL
ncbi:MAG: imidazole glycerol phosphate synthase subunit HisH [Phycisphaerales bacterium]|nr:imidazole glycerol phosphate synthase subunit HisH [Phycisphaerales bacterium]